MFVTVTANPLTVRVEDAGGRLVQEFEFADFDGTISFPSVTRPCLAWAKAAINLTGAVQFPVDQRPALQSGGIGGACFFAVSIGTEGGRCSWPRRTAVLICAANAAISSAGGAGAERGGCVRHRRSRTGDAMREFMRLDRRAGDAAEMGARLHAIAPHAFDGGGHSRRGEKCSAKKKLPCDTFIFLGTGFLSGGLEFWARFVSIQHQCLSPAMRRHR